VTAVNLVGLRGHYFPLHADDPTRTLYDILPMRNTNGSGAHRVKGVEDLPLGIPVKMTGCYIHQDYSWVAIECSGQDDSLSLATGQASLHIAIRVLCIIGMARMSGHIAALMAALRIASMSGDSLKPQIFSAMEPGKSASFCKMMAIESRSISIRHKSSSLLSRQTLPRHGLNCPERRPSSVDFPHPEGPVTAMCSPAIISQASDLLQSARNL
jgi:hypothetical protein